ncbi:MAG: lytic transglycosylase domain-containing protein [Spirochaetaceae bacterium]|jgi:hypothetical protein|nr:lytic transglycosylase domain-containing protein [Spirochaetaceae bacterium]
MKKTAYIALLCRGKYSLLTLLFFLWAGTGKTGTLTNIQKVHEIAIPGEKPSGTTLFEDYRETLYDVINTYRGVFTLREVEIIILTESNGLANAISSSGESYGVGLMQISAVALKDFNRSHNTDYQTPDLYDPFTNIEIGCWVLNEYYFAIENPDLYKVYNAYNVGLYNHRSYYKHYQSHKYPNGKPYNSLKRLEWAIDAYDTQVWRLVPSQGA